ncbi:MAG: hypothetical protein ABI647_07055 [Gemmatimonadota bacterium]
MTGLALVFQLGCGTDLGPAESTPTPAANPSLLGDVLHKLLYMTCSVRPQQQKTITLTSDGGTFAVDYATLVVPAGSIPSGQRRTFLMTTPADPIASVVFTPVDGAGEMRFPDNPSPVVRLSYAHCTGGIQLLRRIAYTTDRNDPLLGLPKLLEMLLSIDNALRREVQAPIEHFSRYAVAF